ncbi:MAG: putative transcriptional regulator, TetR family [Alphaproteobacteria bacterium]|nr:putative transcriptional regulator, TetR family [Alphaproteobacteria bacterium]
MTQTPGATREQIILAADQLFYAGTVASVSMDRIAERAGVTKKTLYYHFRSKDDLLAAYVEARDGVVMQRYRKWAGSEGSVCERIERMFAHLARWATDPGWRGCGFTRVICELADLPGHPAAIAARAHKSGFESWMRELIEEDERSDSAELARMMMILLDGGIVQTLTHRDPAYARAAGAAVRRLLCADRSGEQRQRPLLVSAHA